jgi:hypothetical protein
MRYVSFKPEHRTYSDHVQALGAEFPTLASEFARSDSLENVLDWLQTRDLPAAAVDIIGQDEFSYDFLIRLEPERRWLAFGVN